MNWIKSHKLLTAGIVAGVIVLYYFYKRMQANSAAAAANSTAAFPAYPTVIYGGGGGGGSVASGPGGSQGTAPVASPAAVATIPGANPQPPVSVPAADNVASAVVNAPSVPVMNVGPTQIPKRLPFTGTGGAGESSVYTGGYNLFQNGVYQGGPGGNAPAYDLPGSPNGWTGPSTPVPFIGGGGGFPSSTPVSGNTPMVPMASAGPSLPLNQPQPTGVLRTLPQPPIQPIPGGSLA